jgi:hypothetical protein
MTTPVMDRLATSAPSVLSTEHKPGLSTRYSFVPTTDIIQTIQEFGWELVDAAQKATRNPENAMFAKHMLQFENPVFTLDDGHKIRLLVINSHNGLSSLKFMLGVYRIACMNGLIVASKSFGNFNQIHKRITPAEACQVLNQMLTMLPQVTETYNRARGIMLDAIQREMLALAAAKVAWPNRESFDPSTSKSLLLPNRWSDSSNDLWTIYNRIQENIIKNTVMLSWNPAKNKPVMSRRVRSLDRNIDVNTALWELVESAIEDPTMAKLAV